MNLTTLNQKHSNGKITILLGNSDCLAIVSCVLFLSINFCNVVQLPQNVRTSFVTRTIRGPQHSEHQPSSFFSHLQDYFFSSYPPPKKNIPHFLVADITPPLSNEPVCASGDEIPFKFFSFLNRGVKKKRNCFKIFVSRDFSH